MSLFLKLFYCLFHRLPSLPFFLSCFFYSFSQSLGKCADSSWFWPSREFSNRPQRHPSIPLIKWKIVNLVWDKDVLSTLAFFPARSLSLCLSFYENEDVQSCGEWTELLQSISSSLSVSQIESASAMLTPVVPSHLNQTERWNIFIKYQIGLHIAVVSENLQKLQYMFRFAKLQFL